MLRFSAPDLRLQEGNAKVRDPTSSRGLEANGTLFLRFRGGSPVAAGLWLPSALQGAQREVCWPWAGVVGSLRRSQRRSSAEQDVPGGDPVKEEMSRPLS